MGCDNNVIYICCVKGTQCPALERDMQLGQMKVLEGSMEEIKRKRKRSSIEIPLVINIHWSLHVYALYVNKLIHSSLYLFLLSSLLIPIRFDDSYSICLIRVEYDNKQGSEVKEKEKARNQPQAGWTKINKLRLPYWWLDTTNQLFPRVFF